MINSMVKWNKKDWEIKKSGGNNHEFFEYLTVQQLSKEVEGEAQKYSRIGPLTMVKFGQELTLNNIKIACEGVKSLFNVSKKSRNYIHELYQILDTTTLIDKRKIRLFRQLLANTSTKEYVFRLLHSTDIDFSFVSDVYHVTQQRNLDIVKLMICKNYKLNVANVAITEALEKCKHYIQNWHLYENRIAFRDLLQANVYKTSTEK